MISLIAFWWTHKLWKDIYVRITLQIWFLHNEVFLYYLDCNPLALKTNKSFQSDILLAKPFPWLNNSCLLYSLTNLLMQIYLHALRACLCVVFSGHSVSDLN